MFSSCARRRAPAARQTPGRGAPPGLAWRRRRHGPAAQIRAAAGERGGPGLCGARCQPPQRGDSAVQDLTPAHQRFIPRSLIAAARRHSTCLRDAKEHCRPLLCAALLDAAPSRPRRPLQESTTGLCFAPHSWPRRPLQRTCVQTSVPHEKFVTHGGLEATEECCIGRRLLRA